MGVVDILKVSLEFSPKLGVRELPELSGTKESNIGGLYIVGDLADAPIIKVAINQGYEVAEHVFKKDLGGSTDNVADDVLDVLVVGAGPAGIGAAIYLKEAGAKYLLLEKERPFNTIQNFPKAKFVFSEPRTIQSRGNFWFDDSHKEDLIERWAEEVEDRGLMLHQPEEVVNIKKTAGIFEIQTKVGDGGLMTDYPSLGEHSAEPGAQNTYKARRVILAIGRRGSVNKLGIPGEELLKVAYNLKDPDLHKDRKVMVVGGGDSAVEAAVACAKSGADVTISYRKDRFSRAKKGNQDQIDALIQKGSIRAEMGTSPVEIREDAVVLKRGEETIEVPNDDVFVFIGTKLPKPFLEKIGINFEGQMTFKRAAWIISFALITYLIYVIKKADDLRGILGDVLYPFGKDDILGFVPDAVTFDLGWRTVNGAFWGTVIYSILILIFGIVAYRKYPLKTQKIRYMCLIGFQWTLLFGVPELLAPLFMDRPWRLYALGVPWPLWKESILDGPLWGGTGSTAIMWIVIGVTVSFVILPLFVRFHGERFCSYFCGCGGLAETLGDFWRHLAPRGKTAEQAEWLGTIILVLTVPITILVGFDMWQVVVAPDATQFANKWYKLVVDFWLASVVGVAFYPYLGNRVWCRFLCPLRAWMEWMSKWFSKIAIDANDKCIGCGECTRYCQMGIPVQSFAQKQEQFHNGNSACIQCGICIQVCPMEVLSIGTRGVKINTNTPKIDVPASSGVWGLKIDNPDGKVELRHG